MTEKEAKKIKSVLKKENAVFTATAGYYDSLNKELRVKVNAFIERSTWAPTPIPMDERDKLMKENIIKVLRALSKNGLRPEYRKEQRTTTDNYGTWDCRYLIFK